MSSVKDTTILTTPTFSRAVVESSSVWHHLSLPLNTLVKTPIIPWAPYSFSSFWWRSCLVSRVTEVVTRTVTDRAILLLGIALHLRTFGPVLRQDMQWVAVAEVVVRGVEVVVARGVVAVVEVPGEVEVQVTPAQVVANNK